MMEPPTYVLLICSFVLFVASLYLLGWMLDTAWTYIILPLILGIKDLWKNLFGNSTSILVFVVLSFMMLCS